LSDPVKVIVSVAARAARGAAIKAKRERFITRRRIGIAPKEIIFLI
jgi:hypothetical protein